MVCFMVCPWWLIGDSMVRPWGGHGDPVATPGRLDYVLSVKPRPKPDSALDDFLVKVLEMKENNLRDTVLNHTCAAMAIMVGSWGEHGRLNATVQCAELARMGVIGTPTGRR